MEEKAGSSAEKKGRDRGTAARERAEKTIAAAKETKEVKRWATARKVATALALLCCALGIAGVILPAVNASNGVWDDSFMTLTYFGLGMMLALDVVVFVIGRLEKREIDRQIERIKMLEREEREEAAYEAAADDSPSGKTAEGASTETAAKREEQTVVAFIREQKEENERQTRIRKMKGYVLFDIVLVGICILFTISLFLPYCTLLGKRYNCFYMLGDESPFSLLDMLKNYFSLPWSEEILEPLSFSYLFGFLIILLMIAVCVVKDIVLLFIAYGSVEKNLREETLTVAGRQNRGQSAFTRAQITTMSVAFALYAPLYFYLHSATGGLDLGEWYSVSVFMFVLPLLLLVGWIVLAVYKAFRYGGDEQLKNDKALIALYRFDVQKNK